MKKLLAWFKHHWSANPLFSITIALLVLVIIQTAVLGFQSDNFSDWWRHFCVNWNNVLRNNALVGIVSLGMAFVIISGGIDLAVGSTFAMTGAFFLLLMDCSGNGWLAAAHITGWWAFILAFVLVILFGSLLGYCNGIFIANGGIPPFIVTLGTMKIFRSLTQYYMQGHSPVFPKQCLAFASLEIGNFMIMPIVYWLIIAALLYVVSKKTLFGNHVIAIGSNEKAAKLAGINVKSVKRKVYTLTSALVSLASIISISRIGSMDYANAGSGYEMDAIASVIVGGTRMSGGYGSIAGTMLGVLIIGVMNNLLNLIGVDPFLREAFKGVIIVIAVLLQKKEATS